MNFSLLIDNSFQSCQLCNSGLQMLDLAKNGAEHFVRRRIKSPDYKYDTFHLITSGAEKDRIQSSWTHDPGHFFNTLKMIQPDFDSDIVQAIQVSFDNLNKFRFINGADNLYGGLDCVKLDPGYVVIFTNCDDTLVLQQIEQDLIIQHKFQSRWDQRIIVLLLQPEGKEECDYTPKVSMQHTYAYNVWNKLAQLVGDGFCYQINTLENLLISLDEIIADAQPQVQIQLNFINNESAIIRNIFGDKIVEKNVEKSDIMTNKKILIRSITKPNPNFSKDKLKTQINNNVFSKVYLPDIYPLDIKDGGNYFSSFPTYFIDLSYLIKDPIPLNMPIQELRLQNQQILEYCQKVSQNQRRNTLRFPILFPQVNNPNQDLICEIKQVYGVLQYIQTQDRTSHTLDLLFTMPNYPILSIKIEQIRTPMFNQKLLEKELAFYFRQIPNYYNPCIRQLIKDRKIDQTFINKQWAYCLDDPTYNNYMTRVKMVLNTALSEKKKSDDLFSKMKQLHTTKKSQCCAVLSENYEVVMARQMNSTFRTSRLSQYRNLEDKKSIQLLFPYVQCKSSLPPFIPYPLSLPRNPHQGEDETETRWEPAFCGNPWRLFKKLYKNGVEMKQGHENYDCFNEDLMLTKVQSQNTLNQIKNVKNKRTGFIFLENIKKWRGTHALPVRNSVKELSNALLLNNKKTDTEKIEKAVSETTRSVSELQQIYARQEQYIIRSPYEQDKSLNFITQSYVSKYNKIDTKNSEILAETDQFEKLLDRLHEGYETKSYINDNFQNDITKKKAQQIADSFDRSYFELDEPRKRLRTNPN